jgi:hypothetical protein
MQPEPTPINPSEMVYASIVSLMAYNSIEVSSQSGTTYSGVSARLASKAGGLSWYSASPTWCEYPQRATVLVLIFLYAASASGLRSEQIGNSSLLRRIMSDRF